MICREKEIDDDDTIVDKKIEKEEKIIETFDKVNAKNARRLNDVTFMSAQTKTIITRTLLDCDETMRGTSVSLGGCQTTTRTGKLASTGLNNRLGNTASRTRNGRTPATRRYGRKSAHYCRNPKVSADGIWCYVDAYGGFDARSNTAILLYMHMYYV